MNKKASLSQYTFQPEQYLFHRGLETDHVYICSAVDLTICFVVRSLDKYTYIRVPHVEDAVVPCSRLQSNASQILIQCYVSWYTYTDKQVSSRSNSRVSHFI